MSMYYTGKDGALSIAGQDQVKVTNWSIQADLEMLEITTLGDNDRNYTPGIRSFSGNATLLYYEDAAGRNDAAKAFRVPTRLADVDLVNAGKRGVVA